LYFVQLGVYGHAYRDKKLSVSLAFFRAASAGTLASGCGVLRCLLLIPLRTLPAARSLPARSALHT
jgi:hypothetical protein